MFRLTEAKFWKTFSSVVHPVLIWQKNIKLTNFDKNIYCYNKYTNNIHKCYNKFNETINIVG